MTSSVVWSHEALFTPGPAVVGEARSFTSHQLDLHHLHYLVEDVRLVVSELVTNAVVHARTDLTVRIQETGDHVRLVVHDESSLVPAPRDAHVVDLGGRGLEIVNQCSTAWGTDLDGRGNKAVWALFATHQDGA